MVACHLCVGLLTWLSLFALVAIVGAVFSIYVCIMYLCIYYVCMLYVCMLLLFLLYYR